MCIDPDSHSKSATSHRNPDADTHDAACDRDAEAERVVQAFQYPNDHFDTQANRHLDTIAIELYAKQARRNAEADAEFIDDCD